MEENQERVNFFGDQNVISAYLNQHNYSNPFPDAWIWSFKIGNIRGRRPDHTRFLQKYQKMARYAFFMGIQILAKLR